MSSKVHKTNGKNYSSFDECSYYTSQNNFYPSQSRKNHKYNWTFDKVTNNNYVCEELTCSRNSSSKILIPLKSGFVVFFNVCDICKDTFEKQLETKREIFEEVRI